MARNGASNGLGGPKIYRCIEFRVASKGGPFMQF